ncbi:acyl-CoA desaturase [Fretibacter rubidus]|uniref:acyl-CoA desaturase n=1 Tax=Fretibacter rubidus TaxID=570162 RepID=UPI00352A04F8
MIKANAQPYRNERVINTGHSNACDGNVRWSAVKSLWFSTMALGWLIGGAVYFSWAAVAVFFGLSAIILCLGHSLGMHRKLIHDSFDCPKWVEYIGAYLGTLVGLGGPLTMVYTHDMRDWAQRQAVCHPFFSHQSSMLKDFWWQIHCKLHLKHAPQFSYSPSIKSDKFYQCLQVTSMFQQIPLAIILYLMGGWGFVFWGICGRVVISIFGHWFIGYFAHNTGHRDWHVKGAAVQGHNVRFCGLITFGECWHNNHHAFPGSAKLGLQAGQADPGWWVLIILAKLGIVRSLVLPPELPPRPELQKLSA